MDLFQTVMRMIMAALSPVLLTLVLTILQRKTKFGKLPYWAIQVITGLLYGTLAILATQFGIDVGDGVIMNVRNANPLTAGLIWGGPAGLITGFIGSAYRFAYEYWSGGSFYTQMPSALATLLAGVFAAILKVRVFEGKKPNLLSAIGIGWVLEVFHMLLLLVFNINDVDRAFTFVQTCAVPMIICTSASLFLSTLVSSFGKREEINLRSKSKMMSYDFGFRLLACILVSFAVTSAFVAIVVNQMNVDAENPTQFRQVTIYLIIFMEILIYCAIFILLYEIIKRKIVRNIDKVNEGLNRITQGQLDTKIEVRDYTEFAQLSDDVNAMVDALRGYIADAENRMGQELELARQIQHSALPSVFPPYPNRLDFDIFASMDAAKEVGGDFYDFYLIDPYTLAITIADVSGKGVPAAMFMMNAKTLLKGLVDSKMSVAEAMETANKRLCESNDAEMFITCWLGILDLRTGDLDYCNAGHNPPLVIRKEGEVSYLRTKPNFILAGFSETKYRAEKITLHPGDSIFLYTDGVTEANDPEGHLYGETRLHELLERLGSRHPKEVCEGVTGDAIGFSEGNAQADDITVLGVRLNALRGRFFVRTEPTAGSINIVSRFLYDRLSVDPDTAPMLGKIEVVTDEIYSNIVNYSGATYVETRIEESSEGLALSFTDDGKPFNPLERNDPDITLSAEDRPIGGLGIMMVKKMANSVSYERRGATNFILVKFLPSASK